MGHHKYDYYFGESGGCECQAPEKPARLVIGGWPARGTVFESELFSVGYTRCRPVTDGMGPDIRSGVHVLAFPTRGVFRMHIEGEVYACDPNMVIFQNATDVFRTSHPESIGDDTTWLTLRDELVCEAVRPHDPGVDDRPGSPFPFTVGMSNPEVFLLQRALFNEACRGPDADRLLVEETGAMVLSAAVAAAFASRKEAPTGVRRATVRAHAEMAEGAKAFMAAHLQNRLSIDDIARHVHSSPFHLCRLFRKHTGLPIHRYLNRLRLRAAVDRLHEHRTELAKLAVDLGFASHSHFCDAFRREFGVPPSSMRQRLTDLRSMTEQIRVG